MISGIWRRGRLSRLSLSHIGLHTTALCSRISTIGRTGTRAVKLDTIRMDLRNISFHAALVIIITSTNLAFHIYTGTFTYPFFHERNQIPTNYDIMPLRTFRNHRSICQRIPTFRGCQREISDSGTTVKIANVRIFAYVADQYNLIQ